MSVGLNGPGGQTWVRGPVSSDPAIYEDGSFAPPSQTPQGSLQAMQATAPLPARVSIGTASPVPKAADRPLVPPPLN